MSKKYNGVVIATEEQLELIGIIDVPKGAKVELFDIDKYVTPPYGLGSNMTYKNIDFTYIIPTKWIKLKLNI